MTKMMTDTTLEQLLQLARKSGADAADGLLIDSTDVRVSERLRKPEGQERAESRAIGLRVWVGERQAIVSTTDMSEAHLREMAQQAVAIARASTADADSSLAPELLLARDTPNLDIFDGAEPDLGWLMEQCRKAEDAALSVPGVTNSEGAEASYSAHTLTLMTLPKGGGGFSGQYSTSTFSLSASVLAGEGTGMERDYDYSTTRHRADLPDAVTIGKNAGERAVRRLNPRKAKSAAVPVVFDPRVSKSLVSTFAGAISGSAIARGTSFLKHSMGQPVFSPAVTIIDDPHIRRGLGSKPFDGEGVQNAWRALVENGTLSSWLLDMRTANKLGLTTTGHASRSLSSPPSPSTTNLFMQAGDLSPAELMGDIQQGFYVTETFGMGINIVTGDYSQGASGFWIEGGELAYPVSEVTIAGKLPEMFLHLTPADDLTMRYSTNAPTVRVDGMMVAGS